MAFENKLGLKIGLGQTLTITPQLQQAIKMLQLNRLELIDAITTELTENPVLEIDESAEMEQEKPTDVDQGAQLESQEKEAVNERKNEEFDWDNYFEETGNLTPTNAPANTVSSDDLPNYENMVTKSEGLEEHIMWQIGMQNFTEEEKIVAEEIVGNLNEDGYLISSIEEIATKHNFNVEDAEEILKMIQELDPIGTGSRDLKECLLVQLRVLVKGGDLERRIVETSLHDLERKNYQGIAKNLGVTYDEVIAATKVIMELEPKPGRTYSDNDTHYVTPDIYVYKVGDEYAIVLNEDGLPKLKVSGYYQQVLKKDSGESKDSKDYVKEKLKSAMWLIQSIHNRQKTIYKVMESILKHQRDFFEKGVSALKPLVLRDVANDIGMHESTVSRVTTHKYAHTPVGCLLYTSFKAIQRAQGCK